jgi:organic radical activating enzyme
MNTDSIELPFLSTIGFMLTYKCTISCPHCIVCAGPKRKEEIKSDDCLEWIRQVSLYKNTKIRGVAFTGGEPFYFLSKLAKYSEYASKLNLITSVVTNAYWASSKEEALRTLDKLPFINMLSISTDLYHQKFIPFEFIKNAIYAARKLEKLYTIAVCTENPEDEDYLKIIEALEAIGEKMNIRESITLPIGRGKHRSKFLNFQNSSLPPLASCSSASSPVVFPDGKVSACIGPALTFNIGNPLILGNLYTETLTDILDRAELNLILHTIRIWGPSKIISMLKEHGYESLIPKSFIRDSVCDACYKLFSDEKICQVVKLIFDSNEEIKKELAYARVYYLKETKLAEHFNLIETD